MRLENDWSWEDAQITLSLFGVRPAARGPSLCCAPAEGLCCALPLMVPIFRDMGAEGESFCAHILYLR
ncbi:hypothetical protein HMPREF0239_01862 [Clostridium sp. ATCC BAA-442]|nr:hypothetical protein HMPREF0239_01862 [Clostridium sp. ATCC BAA-442]